MKWALSQGFEECNGNGINGKKRVLSEKSKKEWETWIEEKKGEKVVKKIGVKNVEKVKVNKEVEAKEKTENNYEDEVEEKVVDDDPHDTVGLICLDSKGRLACGTSTSG